jgi:hypothetical protein
VPGRIEEYHEKPQSECFAGHTVEYGVLVPTTTPRRSVKPS